MTDTQWTRYEVFQQRREGAAFENVGSVHAPDAEIALQNARDVFVRRPQTVALWVVPARSILTRTQEELQADAKWREKTITEVARPSSYYIFRKTSQRRSMTFVSLAGEVTAPTALEALARAIDRYGQEETFVWWVVPAEDVVRTREGEAASFFTPAEEKTYRLPSDYHTRTMMREIMEEQEERRRGSR